MVCRRSRTAHSSLEQHPLEEGELESLVEERNRMLSQGMSIVKRSDETLVFKHLADNAAEGIAVTDNEMRLIYINAAFCGLYDHSALDMLGHNPLEFGLEPDERELLEPIIRRAFGDHGSWSGEIAIRREDGSTVPVLVSASNLTDEAGDVTGRVATVTDISEIKWAEARLQEVNAALDAYARTVSHDIRSPLSAVVLANEMMLEALESDDDEKLRDEVGESTASIARNIDKAYALINDLLSLAESGQKPASAGRIDVTDVVALVLEEHAAEIAERGVSVVRDDDFGFVFGSETHVYQVFSNLIANAIAHNDNREPTITLRHRGDTLDGTHEFLIEDNSSGMSADEINSVFKPFQKASGSSGIGLAIVKKIVDVYGGTLRIYNDGGACFEFSLRDMAN
jgi:PAS domain S-box-containing protein